MKVYHAPNSRSVRAVWLLEELGLDYEVQKFALGAAEMRSPEYRAKHPMGRVPALDDGDVTIYESGAIVEYVLARHGGGRMRPAVDSPDFPAYLQWLHYAEGMPMPQVNLIMVETFFLPPERRSEDNLNRAKKQLDRMMGAVDARMAGRDYIAGAFSGADIMMGHASVVASRLLDSMDDKPNVKAYAERVAARPAFQRAMAV